MIGYYVNYSFSDRIKKFMELQDLKQIPLAQKAGRSQSTINRALNSKTAPRIDTLQAIARALNVPVEALTYPDETIATIIYELSQMPKQDVDRLIEHIKKEKLWKHQIAAESHAEYKTHEHRRSDRRD